MKHIVLFLFCLLSFANITAQTITNSIKVGINKFYYRDKKLTVTKLYDIVKSKSESRKEMRKATAFSIAAGVVGGFGVFNIVYPLGMAFAGNNFDIRNLAFGVASIGISIPFSMANKKHLKKAVMHYNSGLNTTSFLNSSQLILNKD